MAQNGNGKLPYFAFYPKDFSHDPKVRLMTFEQRGMYMELLCIAWEQEQPGTLPYDDVLLAKYLGILPEYWLRHKAAVMAAFTERDDKRWHQKRMEKEAEKASKRVTVAKNGAEARWHKNKECVSNASASNAGALLRASGSLSLLSSSEIPLESPRTFPVCPDPNSLPPRRSYIDRRRPPFELAGIWDNPEFKTSVKAWLNHAYEEHAIQFSNRKFRCLIADILSNCRSVNQAINVLTKSIAKGAKYPIFPDENFNGFRK
jgi:uncharacterized protein YdaU (DUF1376 family)